MPRFSRRRPKPNPDQSAEPKDPARERQRALNRLTYYLAQRDHSELELRQKLRRSFPEAMVEDVLAEAGERGWLAKPEELAQRIQRQLSSRGKSQGYIALFLRRKGLPPVSADPEAEAEKCQRVLKTKLGKTASLTFAEKGKAYRWLKQRGFSDAVIKKVLNEKP